MKIMAVFVVLGAMVWAGGSEAFAEENESSTASDVVQSAKNIATHVAKGASKFAGNIVKHVVRAVAKKASGGSTSEPNASTSSKASDVVQSAKNIGKALAEGASTFAGNIVKHVGRAVAKKTRGTSKSKSTSTASGASSPSVKTALPKLPGTVDGSIGGYARTRPTKRSRASKR